MRFHYPRIDVDDLDDESWGKLYNEMYYCLTFINDLKANKM